MSDEDLAIVTRGQLREVMALEFRRGQKWAIEALRAEASRILTNTRADAVPSPGRLRKHESIRSAADFLESAVASSLVKGDSEP